AARSLGMSDGQALFRIVLPQAMRVAVPTLGGYFIGLLKDSSIVGFIAVVDLLRSGYEIVSETFLAFQVYITVGAMYLIISLVAAQGVRWVERRLLPRQRDYGAVLERMAAIGAFPSREQPAASVVGSVQRSDST